MYFDRPSSLSTPTRRWLVVLILSGVLNVGLWAHLQRTTKTLPLAPTSVGTIATNLTDEPLSRAARDVLVRSEPPIVSWTKLASTNFTAYANRLREFGCPDVMIRAILGAEIQQRFAPRWDELFRQSRADYWEDSVRTKRNHKVPRTPEVENARHEMEKVEEERDELLKKFAGGSSETQTPKDRFADDDGEVEQQMFLSEEQRALLKRQEEKRNELQRTLYGQNVSHEEVRRRVASFQEEQMAELAQTFTAEELEEYRLRTSVFDKTRRQLYGFTPTVDEQRALVRLEEKYQGQVPPEELQNLLGPERLTEFQRASDPEFENLYKVGDRMGLPQESLVEAYEMKQQAEQAVREVQENQLLTAEEQASLLAEIKEETQQSLGAVMGERAFTVYQSHSGAWWYQVFTPNKNERK